MQMNAEGCSLTEFFPYLCFGRKSHSASLRECAETFCVQTTAFKTWTAMPYIREIVREQDDAVACHVFVFKLHHDQWRWLVAAAVLSAFPLCQSRANLSVRRSLCSLIPTDWHQNLILLFSLLFFFVLLTWLAQTRVITAKRENTVSQHTHTQNNVVNLMYRARCSAATAAAKLYMFHTHTYTFIIQSVEHEREHKQGRKILLWHAKPQLHM